MRAVYIYPSERPRYALSENGIVYYAMKYCFGDIRVWSRRILLNFCLGSIVFDILIANISWTVAQTPINHFVFRNSAMKTQERNMETRQMTPFFSSTEHSEQYVRN